MQKLDVARLENAEIRTHLQTKITDSLSKLRDNTEHTFKEQCVNVEEHIRNTSTNVPGYPVQKKKKRNW